MPFVANSIKKLGGGGGVFCKCNMNIFQVTGQEGGVGGIFCN